MRKSLVLIYVFFISAILTLSCSSGSSKGGDGASCGGEFWDNLLNSSESALSQKSIKSIITDLSTDACEINAYTGGSSDVDISVLKEEEVTSGGEKYAHVYMLGALEIEGVSPLDYFNMMKLQAKDDESFSEDNGYELDKEVKKYEVNDDSSDSKIKYYYDKETDTGDEKTMFEYCGVASFIKISDELYAVVNNLDTSSKYKVNSQTIKCSELKDVTTLYSISVITGSEDSSSVYLGMKQQAYNHDQQATYIKNMKKFFKTDAKRSYNNAKNYVKKK